MLPYFEPEIVPKVLQAGVRRKNLDPNYAAANCRAVVEAQMMSMKAHSARMGSALQKFILPVELLVIETFSKSWQMYLTVL